MALSKKQQKDKDEADEEELRKNPINVFTCCDKEFDHTEFMQHLQNDHKIDTKELKAKKQMIMHMDGSYWFSYQWKYTLESGLIFSQYTQQVRAKDDMMRYDY